VHTERARGGGSVLRDGESFGVDDALFVFLEIVLIAFAVIAVAPLALGALAMLLVPLAQAGTHV